MALVSLVTIRVLLIAFRQQLNSRTEQILSARVGKSAAKCVFTFFLMRTNGPQVYASVKLRSARRG